MILYQVASRPDEVNCNVHETLALTIIKTRRQLVNLLAHVNDSISHF